MPERGIKVLDMPIERRSYELYGLTEEMEMAQGVLLPGIHKLMCTKLLVSLATFI
jgi:hypothetical protein